MKKTFILIGVLSVAILLGGCAQIINSPATLGSVGTGGAYHYKQYTGSVATTTAVLLNNPGVLGSVIITEDQTGSVVLYDATSTEAYAISQGTRIADFEAAQAEGTYTFDVYVKNGIILQTTNGYNFNGDWTITYKQY